MSMAALHFLHHCRHHFLHCRSLLLHISLVLVLVLVLFPDPDPDPCLYPSLVRVDHLPRHSARRVAQTVSEVTPEVAKATTDARVVSKHHLDRPCHLCPTNDAVHVHVREAEVTAAGNLAEAARRTHSRRPSPDRVVHMRPVVGVHIHRPCACRRQRSLAPAASTRRT